MIELRTAEVVEKSAIRNTLIVIQLEYACFCACASLLVFISNFYILLIKPWLSVTISKIQFYIF